MTPDPSAFGFLKGGLSWVQLPSFLCYRLPGSLVARSGQGMTGVGEIRHIWRAPGLLEPHLQLRSHRLTLQQSQNAGMFHLPGSGCFQFQFMRKKREKSEKIVKGRDLRDKSFQTRILPTTNHVPHSSSGLTMCPMSTGIFICLVLMPKRVHGT